MEKLMILAAGQKCQEVKRVDCHLSCNLVTTPSTSRPSSKLRHVKYPATVCVFKDSKERTIRQGICVLDTLQYQSCCARVEQEHTIHTLTSKWSINHCIQRHPRHESTNTVLYTNHAFQYIVPGVLGWTCPTQPHYANLQGPIPIVVNRGTAIGHYDGSIGAVWQCRRQQASLLFVHSAVLP